VIKKDVRKVFVLMSTYGNSSLYSFQSPI